MEQKILSYYKEHEAEIFEDLKSSVPFCIPLLFNNFDTFPFTC